MNHLNLKRTMIITTILLLVPILIGLLLWQELPSSIATHFNEHNQPNGWNSKPFMVFVLPLIMVGVQWLVFFSTYFDPKKKYINPLFFKIILWLIPVFSFVLMSITYAIALGYTINVGAIVNVLVGILFIVIGNYLHKIKQNYTIGIRIPWTLNSSENWNKTNRVAAWVMMLGGLAFIINGYFMQIWIMVSIVILIVVVPVIYSFILFKKGI